MPKLIYIQKSFRTLLQALGQLMQMDEKNKKCISVNSTDIFPAISSGQGRVRTWNFWPLSHEAECINDLAVGAGHCSG
jgi:hypothetical protein